MTLIATLDTFASAKWMALLVSLDKFISAKVDDFISNIRQLSIRNLGDLITLDNFVSAKLDNFIRKS